MNPKILILAGLLDFSCDLVCIHLNKLGIPFIRINREHLRNFKICLDPVKPLLTIHGNGIDAEIGPELKSVWFRQPVFLRNTPPYPLSPEEQLEKSQWTAFLRALSIFDNARWMNFPKATYLAESKPYQLNMAKRCGFKVPRTIITNDESEIVNYFNDKVAIKSLDTALIRQGLDYLFTYTTIADVKEMRHQDLSSSPLIAQQVLAPKKDLRVTVVGKRIFTVRILSSGEGIVGDWRVLPKNNLQYEAAQLTPEMKRIILKLTGSLGLSFAAVDLAETPEGIYFIEINPTGEWGWLCNNHRRIDITIAEWLIDPEIY